MVPGDGENFRRASFVQGDLHSAIYRCNIGDSQTQKYKSFAYFNTIVVHLIQAAAKEEASDSLNPTSTSCVDWVTTSVKE